MKSESAVKRTPGPWSPNWEDADCNCLVILGLGRPVAQVIHDDALDGDLDETDEANARLIAAAPAMLEALEVIEAALRKDTRQKSILGDEVEYHLDGQTMGFAIDKARAAIHQAKGE